MLKTLMIGLILLGTYSCSSAHIKEPQPVYVINFKFGSVASGTKSFDYKKGVDSMGEWVSEPRLIQWSEVSENVIAFPLEIWLTRIKPALKKLARKNRDARD